MLAQSQALHSIGVFAAHSKHRGELVLNLPHLRATWRSGTAEVTDTSSGALLYRIVRPKTMDMKHGRKDFYDASGSHLFTIRNEFLHPHTFVAFDPVFDQPLFTIKQRSWALHIEFDMPSTVHNSLSGKEESLRLEAGLGRRAAEVLLHDGQVVARIRKRKVDPTRLISALSYILTVCPGGKVLPYQY